MDFEHKAPDWGAAGTEPPASLKTKGFEAGYKPPAAYFNWFWHGVSACLTELQTMMKKVRDVVDGGTGKQSVTKGSYLVGNGTNALMELTPEQVRENIGAASKTNAIPIVPAYSDDGVVYTATVDGVTELINGMIITIIPQMTSTSTAVKLNVNGLGEKLLRVALSFNNAAMTTPRLENYYSEGRPLTIQFDANYATDGAWKTLKQRTSAQDLYGTVPIESGGTGAETAEEARANLGVASADHKHTAADVGALAADDFAFTSATVNLAAGGWTTANGISTQAIAVNGISAADILLIDINMASATADTAYELEEAYTLIGRVASAENLVTFYCYGDVPEVDLSVNVRWL